MTKGTTRTVFFDKGRMFGFDDEIQLGPYELNATTTRVSHILPEGILLRALFIAIRALVNQDSAIAHWTRSWNVKWEVRIDNYRKGGFDRRCDAIEFEKALIKARIRRGEFDPSLKRISPTDPP